MQWAPSLIGSNPSHVIGDNTHPLDPSGIQQTGINHVGILYIIKLKKQMNKELVYK